MKGLKKMLERDIAAAKSRFDRAAPKDRGPLRSHLAALESLLRQYKAEKRSAPKKRRASRRAPVRPSWQLPLPPIIFIEE